MAFLVSQVASLALDGARPAQAAPIPIAASKAAAKPRTDAVGGICATAVHVVLDDILTSVSDARMQLARSAGSGDVDGKVSLPYSHINFRNGDPLSIGDYTGDVGLPFSTAPGNNVPGNDKDVALRARGYLNVTRAGVHTLAVLADGGYQLLIGNTVILTNDKAASLRDSKQVDFQGTGLFPLELVYFHNTGPAILELANSNSAATEATGIGSRLDASFNVVKPAELFTALAGSSSCTECVSDSACGTGGNYCRDGLCQPCLVSSRCGQSCQACPYATPACSNAGACVECTARDTSACESRRFVCDQNKCVACVADTQCQTGQICDTVFGQCIARPPIDYQGGCSAAAASSTQSPRGLVWMLGLLALWLAVRPFRAGKARRFFAAVALVLFGGTGVAQAQTTTTGDTLHFNAQTFRPVIGPGNLFTLDGTLMPRRLRPFGGLVMEYANQPLRGVLTSSGEVYASPVPAQLTAHFMAGFGITRFAAIALDVPVVLYQPFDSRTPTSDVPNTPTAAGLGDLRLFAKIRILDNENGGFGLAAVPQITFPTGSAASFRGDDTVGIEPRVAADYRFKRGQFIALNVGYYARTYNRSVDFGTTRVSDLLRYGLGAGVPIAGGFGVAGEISGAVSLFKLDGGSFYNVLEGLAGVRYTHRSGIEATLAAGGAFVSAVGEPNARVLASIAYVPSGKPRPRHVETRDDDTTTEPLPGARCPDGSVAPASGRCPELDTDKDGIPDRADKCPGEAGSADNSGCPELDTDKDGIPDRLDKCPQQAGKSEQSGCPVAEADTDKDGVPDSADKCPQQAGAVDNSGCPDVDTDKDGVPDRLDKCPQQAGAVDNSGCPKTAIEVSDTGIKLLQPIRFTAGKAELETGSNKVVEELGKAIGDDPSIKTVTIQVSAAGDKKAAKKLSKERAKILAAALIDAGASKKQLKIKPAKAPGEDSVTEVDIKKGKVKAKKEKKEKKPREKKEKKERKHHRRK